ncbi:uncharacterized protein SPSK_05683 [Sporothrix schenckii 1099-18]|uniref:Uncharacterized protein n=1 Tax=Sporothrix schenckii 1099-18 TaxID=1397361 RepID=A0A0F2LYY6_SPOSC|nr:uncharacterized protein SPSK_05683 [Sporothrix schenckii 1099-18]KJR81101.1 hypothetical protein SPSK_05683 [Sporothrix schenckii 1099-18]
MAAVPCRDIAESIAPNMLLHHMVPPISHKQRGSAHAGTSYRLLQASTVKNRPPMSQHLAIDITSAGRNPTFGPSVNFVGGLSVVASRVEFVTAVSATSSNPCLSGGRRENTEKKLSISHPLASQLCN